MLPRRFVANVVVVRVDSGTVNVVPQNGLAACCAGVGTDRDFENKEATCRACGVLPERALDVVKTAAQRPVV